MNAEGSVKGGEKGVFEILRINLEDLSAQEGKLQGVSGFLMKRLANRLNCEKLTGFNNTRSA